MVLEGEQRDSAPHGLILAVLLLLPLGLLLQLETLLVQALQVVDHPPVVQPIVPLLPPGDSFFAVMASSDMRLVLLESEVLPERSDLGSHAGNSHSRAVSRILRIKHPRLLVIPRPEGRVEHSWAQRIMHVQAAVFLHDYLDP